MTQRMKKCILCGRILIHVTKKHCSSCEMKLNRPIQVFDSEFGMNKWYTKPRVERQRKRGQHIETDDYMMRHQLVIQAADLGDLAYWTVNGMGNELDIPHTLRCTRGCNLTLEFKTKTEAEFAMDTIWKEECRARVKNALESALESTL